MLIGSAALCASTGALIHVVSFNHEAGYYWIGGSLNVQNGIVQVYSATYPTGGKEKIQAAIQAGKAGSLRLGWKFKKTPETAMWDWRIRAGLVLPRSERIISAAQIHYSILWIPLWVLTLPCVLILVWLVARSQRIGMGSECVVCSYDLRTNKSGMCPECGTVIPGEQLMRLRSAANADGGVRAGPP